MRLTISEIEILSTLVSGYKRELGYEAAKPKNAHIQDYFIKRAAECQVIDDKLEAILEQAHQTAVEVDTNSLDGLVIT